MGDETLGHICHGRISAILRPPHPHPLRRKPCSLSHCPAIRPTAPPTTELPHRKWSVLSFFLLRSSHASRFCPFSDFAYSAQYFHYKYISPPPSTSASPSASPSFFNHFLKRLSVSRIWPLLSSPATHPHPLTSAGLLRSSTDQSPLRPPPLSRPPRRPVPGIRYVPLPFSY